MLIRAILRKCQCLCVILIIAVRAGMFFSQVLDEEAEVFVVKMWRLLIYETEAKKLGLVK